MSCRKNEEIDIAAYLIDPRNDEWDEFRSHFVECESCAGVLARWTLLEMALRAGPPMTTEHPAPEMLVTFAELPASLDDAEAEAISAHLASCVACRTDLAAMSSFDFSAAARLADEATAASNEGETVSAQGDPEVSSLISKIGDWLAGPRIAIPIALAAAAVALVWLGRGGETGPMSAPAVLESPQMAEERSIQGSQDPGQGPLLEPVQPVVIEAPRIAEAGNDRAPTPSVTDPESTADPTSSADPRTQPGDPSSSRALDASDLARLPIPAPSRSDSEPSQTQQPDEFRVAQPPEEGGASDDVEREVLLLAALDPLGSPVYRKPSSVSGIPSDWQRRTIATRSADTQAATVRVLAPKHVGVTLSPAPSLWWHLSAKTDHPILFRLTDEESVEPILELRLAGPIGAGAHHVDLKQFGVELRSFELYEWSVSIDANPSRPARNPRSFGAIFRTDSDPSSSASPSARRAHVLAESGIWYDAFDAFAQRAEQFPEQERLRRDRDSLLEAADIDL